jgi:hypothetical protein
MAETLFMLWFLFGNFSGYDLHNCTFVLTDPYGPLEVVCGPPHSHETEEVKAPLRSTRQR